MYAQLWSMSALSGTAPYVKRMSFISGGSRLQSPVVSSKLRGTHPKVNYLKFSTGHRSASGVKSQVCACSIPFLSFNKSHSQTAYHHCLFSQSAIPEEAKATDSSCSPDNETRHLFLLQRIGGMENSPSTYSEPNKCSTI